MFKKSISILLIILLLLSFYIPCIAAVDNNQNTKLFNTSTKAKLIVPSNVRSGPSTKHTSILTLSKGRTVEIIGQSGDWYQINYTTTQGKKITGYISKTCFNNNELSNIATDSNNIKKGKVTSTALNVRKAPSTNSQILTTLSKNKEVEILETINDWYKIKYTTTTNTTIIGYASSKHITIINQSVMVDNKAELKDLLDNYSYSFDINTLSNSQINNLIKELKILNTYYNNTTFKISSLDGTTNFSYNESKSVRSCCTVKAAYITYCCKKLEQGNVTYNGQKVTLDTLITYLPKDFVIGSGEIKYYLFGTRFRIKRCIDLAITISDNVAYAMLIRVFGVDEFNKEMKAIGSKTKISRTSMFGTTTAQNRCNEWCNYIYPYITSNTTTSKLLYNYFLNAKYAYIEEGLVNEKTVSNTLHKSGWTTTSSGTTYSNDCAIVLNRNGNYFMGIFTYSTTNLKKISPILNNIWNILNTK